MSSVNRGIVETLSASAGSARWPMVWGEVVPGVSGQIGFSQDQYVRGGSSSLCVPMSGSY